MSQKDAPFKVFVIKWLLHLFALLPLRVAHAIGHLLGLVLWHFSTNSRRVVLKNIALCFPEMSESSQIKLAKANLLETGKNITELGAIWLWPVEKVQQLVTRVSGAEFIEQANREQRGIIFVAPHLGCWELIGLYYPMLCLYRPPRMKQLDPVIRKARTRNGTRLAATDARGVRAILQALRKGEATGILPDQDPGQGNGLFTPFFGVQANTMTLVSKLAIKSKAKVIFTYAERLPKGEGYHLHFIPAGEEIYGDHSVGYMNQQVEQLIRQTPSQYMWSYKRFKSRPEGEKGVYN